MEDLAFVAPSKNLEEAREGLEGEFILFCPSESTFPPLLSLSSSFCLDFVINVERNGFDVTNSITSLLGKEQSLHFPFYCCC